MSSDQDLVELSMETSEEEVAEYKRAPGEAFVIPEVTRFAGFSFLFFSFLFLLYYLSYAYKTFYFLISVISYLPFSSPFL